MRRLFSRFLLIVLAGVLLFAFVRLVDGPSEHDSVVSFNRSMDVDEAKRRPFEVNRRVRLALHAIGSFETDSTLATPAWIVRRSDGKVVWEMTPERSERGRGTLATVHDTLAFDAGLYDAYFSTYGDPDVRFDMADRPLLQRVFGGDGRIWRGDEGRWQFRIDYVSDADRGSATHDMRDQDEFESPEGLVWTSGAVRNSDTYEYLFQVSAPVAVRVQSVGEVAEGEVVDGGLIQTLAGREMVWEFGPDAPWAGGAQRNRRVDTVLTLDPGLYRARYASNRSHAYRSWRGNPPYIPSDWGMTITYADSSGGDQIAVLDPWQGLPRIASFTCVGEGAFREDTFTLPDTTDVLLVAVGEIVGSTSYDYAELQRQDGDRSVEVWSMSRSNTVPAGGADKNRRAEVALQLEPATYTLSYRTDGSHDCSDFNSDPPPDPEHWGATLFALDTTFDPSLIDHTISDRSRHEEDDEDARDVLLVSLQRVGNNADVSATFTLDQGSDVRVYALGELLPSGRYDYAWILPEEAGRDTTWVMTRQNTEWAGGSKKNRAHDETLFLPSGTYTVHYRSNDTHAYGNWDQEAPNSPEDWGVAVWKEGN